MSRRILATLALASIVAAPCVAQRRTAGAVEAANKAKNEFHQRNGPSRMAPRTASVANRSLRVVVFATLSDGNLAIHKLNGEPLGTLNPRTIYEIVAGKKSQFGGRKHLEPSDLEPGQRLKLLIDGRTGEVLKAKVLKTG